MNPLATLHANFLTDAKLMAFRGHERIGRPYRFDVYFTTRQPVDLAKAAGARATVRMARGGAPFSFHGIVATAELLLQTREWALQHAVLVPKLWQLGLTKHSRVFTKVSVPDLLRQVLEHAGLTAADFELRLGGGYQAEELVVQYRESDLDFVQRWMEHEGIAYYFEQGDEREKLVLVDNSGGFERLGKKPLRYHPILGNDRSHDECIDAFTARHDVTVTGVRVGDYDYARPMLEVAAKHAVSTSGYGMVVDHAGRVFDPVHAERFAAIRAEELKCREVLYHLAGNALFVSAGYTSEIELHPTESYCEKKYLVIEASHFCNQLADDEASTLAHWIKPEFGEVYRVEATATDAALAYRTPRTTPWPRVWGYENGIVDGAHDSPYAQIDDHGRYLVKFQFDESDLKLGKASTWVRMMQPHGGEVEGFHFPLRKGTEVIFTFLGGDPDRPVIAGVVPNALRPSTVTEANYTQNVIRTGSENFLKLEDKKGAEFIHALTPNNNTQLYMGSPMASPGLGVPASYIAHTLGSAAHVVAADQHTQVGGIVMEKVIGEVTELFGANHNNKVAANLNHDVGASQNVTIAVDHNHKVGANRNETIGVSFNLGVGSDFKMDVSATWKATAGSLATLDTPVWKTNASSSWTHTSGKTSLTFGPTTIDWAATKGKIASLKLDIPGGASINCPKWEVLDSHHSVFTGAELHVTGVTAAVTGMALDMKALSIGYNFTELAYHTFHHRNEGIGINMAGVKTSIRGLRSHVQGLWSGVAGLFSLL